MELRGSRACAVRGQSPVECAGLGVGASSCSGAWRPWRLCSDTKVNGSYGMNSTRGRIWEKRLLTGARWTRRKGRGGDGATRRTR